MQAKHFDEGGFRLFLRPSFRRKLYFNDPLVTDSYRGILSEVDYMHMNMLRKLTSKPLKIFEYKISLFLYVVFFFTS